ncbi:MAG: amidohydrolase [Planctomycetota bacterium]|jgi:amidohydrolase
MATLSDETLAELVGVRRHLHGHPELSGQEHQTAAFIAQTLQRLAPDEMLTGLGGTGVAALFRGTRPGQVPICIRCELDALPIDEDDAIEHASQRSGVSHKCGHDGHMTICVGVATLQRKLLAAGSEAPTIALLFQPAEETGEGARAVLGDGRLDGWNPAAVVALHNLPGYEPGTVVVRDGTFACGSCGIDIRLTGSPAHAASPGTGRNPTSAVARLLAELPGLARKEDEGAPSLTLVHGVLGQPDFGMAPARGRVMATMRATSVAGLSRLCEAVERLAHAVAETAAVECRVSWHDEFPPAVNDARANAAVRAAAEALGLPVLEAEEPMRFSEDVAHLLARYGGTLFGLGAGAAQPALHDRSYDFPDALVGVGAPLLLEAAARLAERV